MSSNLVSRIVSFIAPMLFIGLTTSQAFSNGPIFTSDVDFQDQLRALEGNLVAPLRELPLTVRRTRIAQTRLRIPAEFLPDNLNSQATMSAFASKQTIIAGIALFLAAGCCFVVLGRRVRNNRSVATTVLVLVAASSFIGGATADIVAVDDTANDGPQIVLEFTKTGDTIELLLGTEADWAK